jgi:hypothetical protein
MTGATSGDERRELVAAGGGVPPRLCPRAHRLWRPGSPGAAEVTTMCPTDGSIKRGTFANADTRVAIRRRVRARRRNAEEGSLPGAGRRCGVRPEPALHPRAAEGAIANAPQFGRSAGIFSSGGRASGLAASSARPPCERVGAARRRLRWRGSCKRRSKAASPTPRHHPRVRPRAQRRRLALRPCLWTATRP